MRESVNTCRVFINDIFPMVPLWNCARQEIRDSDHPRDIAELQRSPHEERERGSISALIQTNTGVLPSIRVSTNCSVLMGKM